MAKNLIIVESPNKVAKIQSFLDAKEYKVIASVGHIRDLSKKGDFRMGVDLKTMTPMFNVDKTKHDVIVQILLEASKAKTIYLATDPDREGEAIAWHIKQVIKEEPKRLEDVIYIKAEKIITRLQVKLEKLIEKQTNIEKEIKNLEKQDKATAKKKSSLKTLSKQISEVEKDISTWRNLVKKHETSTLETKLDLAKPKTGETKLEQPQTNLPIEKQLHATDLEKLENVEFKRITFNEITKAAVLEALANPRTLDINLIHSQETRRILDRMIGFRLSTLARHKIHARSAGRVKSVALRIMVERERELEKFKPDFWFTIESLLKKDQSLIHISKDYQEISYKTKQEAEKVLSKVSGNFKFLKQEQRNTTVKPPKPLEMASYLMGMYNVYKMSNAQATLLAQRLYEKGLISYPRTDSQRISSKTFINEVERFVSTTYGKEMYVGVPFVKTAEGSQDAHEALRPTHITDVPSSLTKLEKNEQKAYEYIWKTTVKSFMPEGKNIVLKDVYEDNGVHFAIKHSVIIEPGFRVIDGEVSQDPKSIKQNDIKIDKKKIEIVEHSTQPPARYNFASLIKKLKEDGIGRPSTYSATTTGLIKFGYVLLKGGAMVPTEMGMKVNDLLLKSFDDIINEQYTKEMEEDLDKIAHNKVEHISYLKKFWKIFEPKVQTAELKLKVEPLEKTGEPCPLCGKPMVYRFGQFGKFKSCSGFPACKHIEGLVKKEPPKFVGRKCPTCGKELVERKSRYGKPFIGCSGYPSCKYHEYEGKTLETKLNIAADIEKAHNKHKASKNSKTKVLKSTKLKK